MSTDNYECDSCIQQTFIECLVYPRHYSIPKDIRVFSTVLGAVGVLRDHIVYRKRWIITLLSRKKHSADLLTWAIKIRAEGEEIQ